MLAAAWDAKGECAMKDWLEMALVVCVPHLFCGCTTHGGPISSHFDGARFFNPERDEHSLAATARWLWEMKAVDWPKWVDDPLRPPPPERARLGALRATYINHATVLLQTDGLNILTDPIWSTHAGPATWLGVRRVRSAGVPFEQLPRIDLVLISHDHYDHLDAPTIERLWARDHPTFLVGLGVGAVLRSWGVSPAAVVELDWWDEYLPPKTQVRIVFVPARHTSGRGPFSVGRTLWGGFLLGSSGGQIYFAGDTGYGAFLNEIAERSSCIRLAILPVGSYEKRWFMRPQHLNPEDAVQVHTKLRAQHSIGIHYATFAEHPEQSIDAHEKDLAAALASSAADSARFRLLGFGEGWDVPPLEEEVIQSTSVGECP
jgi:L-ascorbate metabolism protein UlaG (beta-lactamase superfamily)